jgi:drug/metabolite transporter (DMT)-like permease
MSSLRITAWTAYAGTPALVLAGLPDAVRTDWTALGWPVWAALGYSTLLSLVLAYWIWNRSVREVGGTKTAIYMCITPLVGVLVAWAALGERPGPLHAAGGALILVGVVLARRARTDVAPPAD